ncbi:polysaccharide ABC transporter ATP-binding protein [Aequorivita xiaoshiensis]|uniref:ATP-binding cassette domain-containing protein n=1 Tax=Aequorivita xiaoshiensis TaxID=2874476 RepID=A0A9X1R523_9FLAO|nr:ABC transporter ATP-binding protein [Aequorivita xiaoshiensis]MCG2432092.1 ATP-binding cassette domain-containing protein [Aequorivita xiaoshiensis]
MIILKAENISKQYRLGNVGTGTLSHDLNRFWHKIRGKEDPYLKVGAVNDRSSNAKHEYVWALRDINFEVKQGEVLGIIGKNGAGKSTLLKILSRVTTPSTGSIKTKGNIASLLEVGTGFHPELTGRENIFLNGAILGMTRAEIKSKLDEIVDFSGCEMYIDTPVKRYSSGMKVRLAFAVAAHLEPDILVVDEVLAVGDAEFQKKAIGKMQDISSGDGRTVLFVSHNMESIQKLCTRCVILENGKTIFQGDVDSAISKYLASNKKEDTLDFPIELKSLTILDFAILDNLNNRVKAILLGKACSFVIKILNTSHMELNLNLRFQIFNENEMLLTTLNTFHVNENKILNSKEQIELECSMDKLPITEGTYYIGIQILDLYERKVLYQNNNWDIIEVYNGDFFETGKLPSKNNLGSFLLDYKWISKHNEGINDKS